MSATGEHTNLAGVVGQRALFRIRGDILAHRQPMRCRHRPDTREGRGPVCRRRWHLRGDILIDLLIRLVSNSIAAAAEIRPRLCQGLYIHDYITTQEGPFLSSIVKNAAGIPRQPCRLHAS